MPSEPETTRGTSVPRVRDLHPRLVPGYDEARAAGLLPVVPEQPPRLVVQPTALGMFHRFAVLTVGGLLVLCAGAAQVVDRLALPGQVKALLIGSTALASLVAVVRALPSIGRQSLAELQQGYTTLVLAFGGFWYGEGPRTSSEMGVAWDYRGTWHLDHRDGRVVRAPDRSVDPPGMYPSPNQPGRMELWTGAAWQGHFGEPR